MIKANYPTQKVVASYQIAPEFLAILLTDLKTRRSAVECFNTETTDIVGAYVSKA
jgi:hypothetical protein